MLEKVRSTQSEILMINKNLAANLKKQRTELSEVQNQSHLNLTIIESLLVQAVTLESAMQLHLDGHSPGGGGEPIKTKAPH